MLMRDLLDEVLELELDQGQGPGGGRGGGGGCRLVRCFLISYLLISELTKQVNWPGPL